MSTSISSNKHLHETNSTISKSDKMKFDLWNIYIELIGDEDENKETQEEKITYKDRDGNRLNEMKDFDKYMTALYNRGNLSKCKFLNEK